MKKSLKAIDICTEFENFKGPPMPGWVPPWVNSVMDLLDVSDNLIG